MPGCESCFVRGQPRHGRPGIQTPFPARAFHRPRRKSSPGYRAQLESWVRGAELVVLEQITRGLANTPAAYCELMSGKTCGKALVELEM